MIQQSWVKVLRETLLSVVCSVSIAVACSAAFSQSAVGNQILDTTYAGGGAYVNAPPLSVAMEPASLVTGPGGGIYVDVPLGNESVKQADERNEVFRIDPTTGKVTRVVGNGVEGSFGIGGPPTDVSLNDPLGLAFDNQGNLYIADAGNHRILKVSADPAFDPGTPTALAGGPITSRSVVSVFSTSFSHPVSLAFDSSFSNLYVATTDYGVSGVTRLNLSNGAMTTVAGCAQANTPGCGVVPVSGIPATSVPIVPDDDGNDLAFDAAGNLYVAAAGGDQVERVFRVNIGDDKLTIVAGPESSKNSIGCTGVGTAGSVSLGGLAIAFDGAGDLLLADLGSRRVCRISPDSATGMIDGSSRIVSVAGGGTFSQFAQYGQPGYGDGGAADSAVLLFPDGIAVDRSGNIFVADRTEGRVRKIPVDPATGTADGGSVISTAAGGGGTKNGGTGGDGNLATAATMNAPVATALDAAGDLFVGSDGVIRRVDAKTHVISTVAGYLGAAPSDCPVSYEDGEPATCARFDYPGPKGLTIDSAGDIYVANGNRVQEIDSSGTITTVAGGAVGSPGCGDNAPAIDACLSDVHGLAFDPSGDLYIADTGDHEIREVTPDGMIRRIAGTGQACAINPCTLGGGLAIDTPLDQPMYLVWGPAPPSLVVQRQSSTPIAIGGGLLYFTDPGDTVIRVVDLRTDTISTLSYVMMYLANGTPGYWAPVFGLPTVGLYLGTPTGIAMDAAGNLFVSITENSTLGVGVGGSGIFELPTPEATGPDSSELWVTTTESVVPDSYPVFGNPFGILHDGYVSSPQGLAIDSKGDLYVADKGFHRIQVIRGAARARGDVNGDGQVDIVDLDLVMNALNTTASGPHDLRDLNHDGVINVLDARILVTLCTYPGCATSP